jgi:hypothetical protein
MKKLGSYGRKMLGFFMVHFTIIAFYAMSAPWRNSSKDIIAPCLIAMVFNLAVYIGGNVYSTLVKSKYFQPDLVGK